MAKNLNSCMNCSPNCPFFPDVYCQENEWEYNAELQVKKRKNKKDYICGYDGHIITSWYESCPKKEEEKNG